MPLAPYRRNRSSTKCYQITLGSLGKLLLLSPKRFLGESLPLTFFPPLILFVSMDCKFKVSLYREGSYI